MFYLYFMVSLGPMLLEKTIFGYFKAMNVVARPGMREIQNLQFATGKFWLIRLQTSIMVLRRSFRNNNFKSKKELG